jgi:hypothetical protein
MGFLVVMGAMMTCTFGVAPSALMVIPGGPPCMAGGPMAATIMDSKPVANIPPFGMCNSVSNPTVAAATTAALGVLTPMPCVPVTMPWMPGCPTVLIDNLPALNDSSKCMCSWGGVISITFPGQTTVMVP